jgi:CDP-glucose 4,6-dehydratase
VVFHLAAQPLVRRSYLEPVETWQTNVMGTIHVLEALKSVQSACAAVMITTDKCYENREWIYGYRESDPLGGYDPYSSSKAGAELAIASWRKSFFSDPNCPIGIASARAGNVIGGGDWAEDRIVPDAMRSLMHQEAIPVRNPQATRPWQHVLEPLGGYLLLAQRIYQQLTDSKTKANKNKFCSAFNFGPSLSSNRTVQALVEEILKFWLGSWVNCSHSKAVHEANLLNLATDKAFHFLEWQPKWNFEETIAETVSWYQKSKELHPQDSQAFQSLTLEQIQRYQNLMTQPSINLTS